MGMELAFLCPPNLIGRLLRDSEGVEDLYSLLVRCEIHLNIMCTNWIWQFVLD